ncbi:hypothetical protein BKA70DRAFT_1415963 [Coprinopsis sp. MPI-PUGE-AT-0042]|nr:hypothetical protein BKA70DRAFT_1415963 [Coprinopsis sp. MPI-PUGE-AT-0042]
MSRRQNVKVPLGDLSKHPNARPLYTRPLPWWATRAGSAGLLFCTLAFAGSSVLTTWNYWTEPVPVKLPAETPGGEERQVIRWNLRPAWQRGGLCLAHTLAGCMFAGGILAKRSLYIRSVYLVSPSVPANQKAAVDLRRLIVQSAGNSNSTGYEFPVQGSWLEEGESREQIVLRSTYANVQSRFVLPLQGASVCGQEYPLEEARGKLIAEWRTLQPPAAKKS